MILLHKIISNFAIGLEFVLYFYPLKGNLSKGYVKSLLSHLVCTVLPAFS